MLYPTINELTKGDFNRYELSIATAKCARKVTEEYVSQRQAAEEASAAGKDSEKTTTVTIEKELRDEKSVKIAIKRIYNEDYLIKKADDVDEDDMDEEIFEEVEDEVLEVSEVSEVFEDEQEDEEIFEDEQEEDNL